MRLLTGLFASLLVSTNIAAAEEQAWRFRVWLDDKEIGHHDFVLEQQGPARRLRSEASFEYKLLFVKLYEYEHRNTETWQDGCLTGIDSSTEANGKTYAVSGEQNQDQFVLRNDRGVTQIPECIMSFAYWNPAFLQQERLLNSQNGDLVEIEVSEPEPDELEVRGARQPAWRYRLQAGDLNIRLWYSEDNDWLALESDARGGRVLRYELL